MAWGVTPTGFNKKTFNDIITDIETDLKSVDKFGADFDFRDATPQKNLMGTVTTVLADLWDVAEDVYYSAYLDTAEDVSLDYVIKTGGISRDQANKSTGQATFSGTDGVIVPVGFVIKTTLGIKFVTTASGTISSGTVVLAIQAVEGGVSGDVAAGSITVIETPLAGLTSVTNASETSGGLEKETDLATKTRYQDTLAKGGGSTSDSIRASLLQLDGVTDAKVLENDTDATVSGIPPHSIAPIVLGGTDSVIHDLLRELKVGGNQCHGSISTSYTDDSGNSVTVGFDRPTNVNIYLQVTVVQGPDFPGDGLTQIQTLLVNYINALLIGADVIHWDLLIEVGKTIEGVEGLTILTSKDNITYLPNDIVIADLEKAITDNAKVVVT